jgi:hypothetical protein
LVAAGRTGYAAAEPKDRMMDKQARKEALAAYKERKPAVGIYAVTCEATGEVWVGSSPNVDKQQNRIWFEMDLGRSRHTALQTAWKTHGAAAFRFEELERLDEDLADFALKDATRQRLADWRETLRARVI